MSSISAGTTSGTALVSTADTSGTLQLQVNGTTPAVTLNTGGAIGVGSSPAYGTSGQVLTSAGSGSAPSWTTISAAQAVTTYTNQSANVTLTSANANSILNFTLANDITVTMPDATTLTAGRNFTIKNNSPTYGISVYDAGANYLFTLPPNNGNTIWASSIATTAGEWTAQDQIFDYLSGPSLAPTYYTGGGTSQNENPAVALSTTQFVTLYYQASQLYAVVGTYSGGAITYGTPVLVSVLSGSASICATSSTTGVIAFANNVNANFAITFSVSGTTITLGTLFTDTSIYSEGFISVTTLSSTSVAFVFQKGTDAYIKALTISGSTITSASSSTVFTTSDFSGIYLGVTALSSTTVAISWADSTQYNCSRIGVLSGGSWTFGVKNQDVTLTVSWGYITTLSSSAFSVVVTNGTNVYAKAYTVSGSTITAGTAVNIATGVGANNVGCAALSATSVVCTYGNTNTRYPSATIYTVSGTTVTASGVLTSLNSSNNSSASTNYNYAIAMQAPAVATPSASSFLSTFALFGNPYNIVASVSGSTITTLATNAVFLIQGGIAAQQGNQVATAFNKTQFIYVSNNTLATTARYSLTATLYNVTNTTSVAQSSASITVGANYSAYYSVCAISPTVAVLVYSNTANNAEALVITRSGNTISFGTPTVIDNTGTTTYSYSLTMLSSTTVLLSYKRSTGTNCGCVVLTVSGTSVSAGTITNLVPSFGGTVSTVVNCALSSTFALVGIYTGNGNGIFGLNISGTTITTLSTATYAGMGDGTVTYFDIKPVSSTQAVFASSAQYTRPAYFYESVYGTFLGMVNVYDGTQISSGGYTLAIADVNSNYHQSYSWPTLIPVNSSGGVLANFETNQNGPDFLPYNLYQGAVRLAQNGQTAQPSSRLQSQAYNPCSVPLVVPAVGANPSSEAIVICAELVQNTAYQTYSYSFRKYNSKGAIK